MRIALVCPSVGITQRGYERFVTDLFRVISEDLEVTLFKGSGSESPRERVIPHLRRSGWLEKLCLGRLRYLRHRAEFLSFALGAASSLRHGRFDIVHFIDPALAPLLQRYRRSGGGESKLLFTNGGTISFESSQWVDHIHCLTPAAEQEARAAGIGGERLSMIPVGVEPARFETSLSRQQLRKMAGIPEDAFVVLCIASVNRHHKRIDYLIEELARPGNDCFLWLDGSLHPDGDPSLLTLASERLGSRFRYSHLPSSRVGELFRLADLLVSAALHESFGMALVEAASCGLPVVAHDSPHFRWLLGSDGATCDMTQSGRLALWVQTFRASGKPQEPESRLQRYNWQTLKSEYVSMYMRLGTTPPGQAQSDRRNF